MLMPREPLHANLAHNESSFVSLRLCLQAPVRMEESELCPVKSLPPNITQQPFVFNPDDLPAQVWICAALYSACCIIGIMGNVIVMYVLGTVFFHGGGGGGGGGSNPGPHQPVVLFVLSLSIVDSLVLLIVPFNIAHMLNVPWMLGEGMCKIHWSAENLNKILSTFLLLALSAHCYINVCHSQRHDLIYYWQQFVTSCAVIVACALFAVALMTPVYRNSLTVALLNNGTWITTQCMFYSGDSIFPLYSFCCAFLVPTLLQIFFYGCIILHVYWHISANERSTIPFWKVVRSAMLLLGFYLFCWVPYWIYMLFTYFSAGGDHESEEMRTIVAYFIHTLPYLNAAVNPSLYIYLNKSIRQAYTNARRSSVEHFMAGKAANNGLHSAKTYMTTVTNSKDSDNVLAEAMPLHSYGPETIL